MLEHYFHDPRVIARIRRTSLGPAIDDLAKHLHARGHSQSSGQEYLRGAGHFAYWIDARRIAISDVREETVRRFLNIHVPRCRCPIPRGLAPTSLHAAMGHLLLVLRDSGRTAPSARPPSTGVELAVQQFVTHLRDVQGAKETTCRRYHAHVFAFLTARFGTRKVDLSRLRVVEVSRYVEEKAANWKPKTAKLLATSLRSFFRFMQITGRCEGRLLAAVPTIPEWKHGSVPRYVSDAVLRALLTSFRSTPIGRRDRAMCLCLCRLALRAGEVAGLLLEDIDWRDGTVRLGGKSRRASILPLPPDVGDAIVEYLRHGRPQTQCRRLFVQHRIPVGIAIDAGTVRAAIRRGFTRTGLEVVSKGTHVLRHTAATNMVRGGATLKEVADVLRHRCLDTTTIYAKVDVPRLAEVAMPWPEVQS